MQYRPIMLPLAALAMLATMSALRAEGGGRQHRQAQLRISLTVVDSCDIRLLTHGAPGRGEAAQVDCSGFMPHQLVLDTPEPTDETVLTLPGDGSQVRAHDVTIAAITF